MNNVRNQLFHICFMSKNPINTLTAEENAHDGHLSYVLQIISVVRASTTAESRSSVQSTGNFKTVVRLASSSGFR